MYYSNKRKMRKTKILFFNFEGGDGDGEHQPYGGDLRHHQLAAGGDQHEIDHHVECPLQLQHQRQLLCDWSDSQQGSYNYI